MDYGRRCDDGAPLVFSGKATMPRNVGHRLPERILALVHQACDQGELELSRQLLDLVETAMARRGPSWALGRKRVMESLVLAYQRWWHLSHPAPAPELPAGEFRFIRDALLGDGPVGESAEDG